MGAAHRACEFVCSQSALAPKPLSTRTAQWDCLEPPLCTTQGSNVMMQPDAEALALCTIQCTGTERGACQNLQVLRRPHFLLVTLVLCNAAATEV